MFGIHSWCCWRRWWHPTPVLLAGKSHGWSSLVGCSPWDLEDLDTTEWLHFHFSLSCIGEGNGNPLQCSCLENPGNRGAWWAAVYGVAQSWTWLKRLSCSSSSMILYIVALYFFYYCKVWLWSYGHVLINSTDSMNLSCFQFLTITDMILLLTMTMSLDANMCYLLSMFNPWSFIFIFLIKWCPLMNSFLNLMET